MRQKTIQMLSGDVMSVARRCPDSAPVWSLECEAVSLFSVYSCIYSMFIILYYVLSNLHCTIEQKHNKTYKNT